MQKFWEYENIFLNIFYNDVCRSCMIVRLNWILILLLVQESKKYLKILSDFKVENKVDLSKHYYYISLDKGNCNATYKNYSYTYTFPPYSAQFYSANSKICSELIVPISSISSWCLHFKYTSVFFHITILTSYQICKDI